MTAPRWVWMVGLATVIGIWLVWELFTAERKQRGGTEACLYLLRSEFLPCPLTERWVYVTELAFVGPDYWGGDYECIVVIVDDYRLRKTNRGSHGAPRWAFIVERMEP